QQHQAHDLPRLFDRQVAAEPGDGGEDVPVFILAADVEGPAAHQERAAEDVRIGADDERRGHRPAGEAADVDAIGVDVVAGGQIVEGVERQADARDHVAAVTGVVGGNVDEVIAVEDAAPGWRHGRFAGADPDE